MSAHSPFFAEMAAATNFSFLRGASHPHEMMLTAVLLGHGGIGIADRNTVAGVVRAHAALEDLREGTLPLETVRVGSGPGETVREIVKLADGITIDMEALKARAKAFKYAAGTRFSFADGTPDIVAYPENREGWGRLCRLLTLGNLRGKKGECILNLSDLVFRCRSLLMIVMVDTETSTRPDLPALLGQLKAAAPGALWIGASMNHGGTDRRRLARLKTISLETGVPLIAVADALYHDPGQRDLQDVISCIREGVTIETAGRRLEKNAERHLKPAGEMARLFADCPEAVAETQALLARVDFDLTELKYLYPEEPVPLEWEGQAQPYLEHLTWRRAVLRYPNGIPDKVERVLKEELELIDELEYAQYFLTIYDIVRFAESKGILCQGRGSAANSAVCYVLGITAIDPADHELLYARFMSAERKEPPDIDVDFEHERREEVIQHIYDRYGRERAGIAATIIRYRPKSAIREVGKALGLSEDVTARIAGTVWGSWSRDGLPDERIRDAGLDPANPMIRRAAMLATRLLSFPRHLSQHVGGFVLTNDRLDETVPIGNAAMPERTFIEWDKDDIDHLRMMKVDVLALGMLTCIRKAFGMIDTHYGKKWEMADLDMKDEPVYEMLQKGDSIGVFQVESRAQINMLPRLRPASFYDLAIQVAIVRPGPIQGDMVHPYLRRRKYPEEAVYPSPAPPNDQDELRNVLSRTLGVPLFQEQAMKIAMVAAKFTDVEANQLRKAMATFRSNGQIGKFEAMMVERMVERGYEREFAQRCFDQIRGFGDYGFPESHAASFAKLVYVSAWIKCHYPAVFAAALLNSQPMGFYAPAQIVRDAREHDVEVRPPDVNHSSWDNTLESCEGKDRNGKQRLALRIGLRQLDGLSEKKNGDLLIAARGAGFASLEDLWRRTRLPHRALRILAEADAMRSLGLDRRAALWAVRRLPDDAPLPLFFAADARELAEEGDAALPAMRLSEHVVADYQTTRLSLKAHPMQFLRETFDREGVLTCEGLETVEDAGFAQVAGIVLVRQRPGNGNAIFMTVEDETGIANALIWARRFEDNRRAIMAARLAVVEGFVQRSAEGVIHLIVTAVHDRTEELDRLSTSHQTITEPGRGDHIRNPQSSRSHGHPRDVRVLPKSRDFH